MHGLVMGDGRWKLLLGEGIRSPGLLELCGLDRLEWDGFEQGTKYI